MANKMLIDATHPEETRVVVLRGKRVQEFDYESAARKQLRGNIYLAKVTRVEPSLQAAFVDYGGNRHGFLAFSEIHPDYYQIPVADREALLEEEFKEEAEAAALDEDQTSDDVKSNSDETDNIVEENIAKDDTLENTDDVIENSEKTEPEHIALDLDEKQEVVSEAVEQISTKEEQQATTTPDETTSEENDVDAELSDNQQEQDTHYTEDNNSHIVEVENDDLITGFDDNNTNIVEDNDAFAQDLSDLQDGPLVNTDDVESVGSEDALEEVPERVRKRKKTYKIQEVIKRRQIILVQVVKEERGNKGAALTTYLSLAGRHTVLMPNTARGGGISRKITNLADRKRLRKIATELEVPEGTGLIIRTAGASRTKAEIKRDYDYLLRLWENVRDLTMESTAPAVVYEEGDLIKRSIRDLYSKEVDEVLVAGEAAHKDAKHFMRMIMPSHSKNVKLYKDSEPIFIKNQIEHQLNELYSPYVTLPSGGYIVINQTEALVSVDVNSGKSTKEHNIEDTAVRTNLEAAEEISRQLKLRDLAGLVVIDFIDMEERKNNRAVERKLKDCLRSDRARIQIGRISHFGLLEMSRQRLRTGVLEGSTTQCPHCQGTGIIRSTDSVALSVLRVLEDTLLSGEKVNLSAITSVDVALYILNHKRLYLKDIETRYDVNVSIIADQKLQGANFQIERAEDTAVDNNNGNLIVKMDWGFQAPEYQKNTSSLKNDEEDNRKRRKRKRRSKDRDDNNAEQNTSSLDEANETSSNSEADTQDASENEDERNAQDKSNDRRSRTRRRGRRGGRRHRSNTSESNDDNASDSRQEAQDQSLEAGSPEDQNISGEEPQQVEVTQDNNETENGENSSDNRKGRSRRRYPASRKRGPRRKPKSPENDGDQSSENGQFEKPVAAEASTETPKEASSEPKEKSSEKRTPRKKQTEAEKAPSEPVNKQPQVAAASNTNTREQSFQPQSDTMTIEDKNSPARKGWWQKRG